MREPGEGREQSPPGVPRPEKEEKTMTPGEWRFQTQNGWTSVTLIELEDGSIVAESEGVRYGYVPAAMNTPIGAIHACCREAFGIQPWEIWEIRGPGEQTYQELLHENSELRWRVDELVKENRGLAEPRGRLNEALAAGLRALSSDRPPEIQELVEEACRLMGVPRAL